MKNVLIVYLILGITTLFTQTDIENSKDYQLLDRLPNYEIVTYKKKEFDAHKFFVDKKYKVIEGKKYVIKYGHQQ